MDNLAADFTINNNQPLTVDYELNNDNTLACSFEIFASGTVWGSIAGDISNQTDLYTYLTDFDGRITINSNDILALGTSKQDVLTAGANIQITDNVISATDTTYTAGSGIDITNNVISCTVNSAQWGNITGILADQTDLQNALNAKQDVISDLSDIRTDATNGATAYATIQTYGDIVTYNAANFATSAQGSLADTALQPNDNISELVNDAGYITSASLPTVNDATITIQKNGTDVESFTLNQSSNETINISVPTDTADLTNGAGFITSSSLPTVNDGKLTLQVNNVDIGEFTANQSSTSTINITIPTDTADLTNSAGFITNNATGSQAIALGSMSTGTGIGSIAYGYSADATSTYATAIGWGAKASNTNTIAIGKSAKATQAGAIAIGTGAEANGSYSYSIGGINNTANSFQVYTYNMLDMSTGLIPDARISTNIARSADIPTFDTNQMAAINSGANTTNIGQIATNTQDISDEITNRQNADNGLQSQIDALVVASDVFDIVGTYAELQAYDISTVPVNDIIKVLVDSTHNDAATYYRCVESGGVKSWSYIGSEGAYYTKGEADSKFALQTTTVNSHALSSNITLTASDVGALPDSTVIPTVNNSSITFQKNGTDFDTITLNQSGNDTINITVPTDTLDLTNGAGYITGITSTDVTNALGYTPYSDANPNGFITGITSGDVTNALGYTPYSDANPNGYTSNVGTVTSVNNVSPVSGNVTISIPTDTADLTNGAGYITSSALTDYVTTNTTQTISARKTFTGEKAIYFKQTATSDKLGFTLYNPSNTELGALEWRPNTINGNALLALNCPQSGSNYVGFRYWSNINIVAPRPTTNGNYFIPVNVTDGNTTVTANSAGLIDISSLLPTIPTVDQTFDGTSANAQSGVAIAGELNSYVLSSALATVATTGAYSDLTGTPTFTYDSTNERIIF